MSVTTTHGTPITSTICVERTFIGNSRHEFVKYTYTVAATDLSLVLYR
jgi:hypothetical protein